jgi:hypothetical protein
VRVDGVFGMPGFGSQAVLTTALPEGFSGCWSADVPSPDSRSHRNGSLSKFWWPRTYLLCFPERNGPGEVSYLSTEYDPTPLGRQVSALKIQALGQQVLRIVGIWNASMELRYDVDCAHCVIPGSDATRFHLSETLHCRLNRNGLIAVAGETAISSPETGREADRWHAQMSPYILKPRPHAPNPVPEKPGPGWRSEDWEQFRALCQRIADEKASGWHLMPVYVSSYALCSNPPIVSAVLSPPTSPVRGGGKSLEEAVASLPLKQPQMGFWGSDTWGSFTRHCQDLAAEQRQQAPLSPDERTDALVCIAQAVYPETIPSPRVPSMPSYRMEYSIVPAAGWEIGPWLDLVHRCQDIYDKINTNQLIDQREFAQAHVCEEFGWYQGIPANGVLPRWFSADHPPSPEDVAPERPGPPRQTPLPTPVRKSTTDSMRREKALDLILSRAKREDGASEQK